MNRQENIFYYWCDKCRDVTLHLPTGKRQSMRLFARRFYKCNECEERRIILDGINCRISGIFETPPFLKKTKEYVEEEIAVD